MTTYAHRANPQAAWTPIRDGTVIADLGVFGRNVAVTPAFVAALAAQLGAEAFAGLGFAAVVEVDRPLGVKTAVAGLGDVEGVPTRTWSTTNYSAPERAALRTAKLGDVKAEASRRILAQYPIWRQINMTARATELTELRFDRDWTGPEAAEAAALKAVFAWIKSVRAASDVIEAAVPTAAAEIAAFDPAAAEGWPA